MKYCNAAFRVSSVSLEGGDVTGADYLLNAYDSEIDDNLLATKEVSGLIITLAITITY
ncbi:MAG: hypothetical protein ACJA2B_001845 [Candidatus Endobugula sp.]|jgi:hypothetical protein